MITRERLEELIEQGVTIWGVADYTYHESKPYKRLEYFDLRNTPTFYKNNIDEFLEMNYNIEFFETKEEAEWELEFGNITRTKTLRLPSWEELKQKISSNGYGNKTIVNFDNYIFEYKRTKTQVVLGINLGCETLFYGELTLANYTDACKLAKKLFLGEKE